MNVLALCPGVGGLELGIKRAEPRAAVVCYVERDAYCAATLVARMEDQALDQAPVWSDLRTFDARQWRGTVDCVVAGFPCQPASHAGKRAAQDDERWLWPDIAWVIRDVGCRRVFLENVPGLLSAGLGDVLGDLAEMGFAAEWGCVSAANVGASHLRERVYIMADAPCIGRREGRAEQPRRLGQPSSAEHGEPVDDAESGDEGLGLFPPAPVDLPGWREWLRLYPETEPAVCGSADGVADRVDRLRACGNGVVPLAAAHAWRVLDKRLREDKA